MKHSDGGIWFGISSFLVFLLSLIGFFTTLDWVLDTNRAAIIGAFLGIPALGLWFGHLRWGDLRG
jgi:hypothetical protein